MTDPTDLPPAPPLPLADAPPAHAEPWQLRFEVLAVLLVVSVAVVLVAALSSAYAQLGTDLSAFAGDGPQRSLSEVVRLAGAQANPMVAGALLVAFLLVTLGPGDRIGRRGTTVLRGLVGVGLVTAGLAGVSAVLSLTDSDGSSNPGMLQGDSLGDGLVGRLSAVAPLIVAAVIAGFVAWCAFSTLGEVPAEPVVPGAGEDEGDDDDFGDEPSGFAPPPAPLR